MPRFGFSRVLPYRPEQLFGIAADVERYPEFLPWWLSAKILRRDGDVYYTDQIVGFGPIRQRFSTRTVLRRPDEIEVTSADRQFESFQLIWRFGLLPEGQCKVALAGELELRAPFLHDLFGRMAVSNVSAILSGFEHRARRMLGTPSH